MSPKTLLIITSNENTTREMIKIPAYTVQKWFFTNYPP
jgi:hypothetical protein